MHPIRYRPRLMALENTPMSPLEREFGDEVLFSGMPGDYMLSSTWNPPVDFVEDKNQYTILMDAPGMMKPDIHVDFKDGILYVQGKREHEKEVGGEDTTKYTLERRCGGFMRHFHLQVNIVPDKIRADYKNGILKVTVPKNKKAASKQLSVKVN